MEEKSSGFSLKKQNLPVAILAVISCGCSAIGFLTAFMQFGYEGTFFSKAMAFLLATFYTLLRCAPSVLLLLYLLVFQKKGKGAFFIPMTFAGVLATYFFNWLEGLSTTNFILQTVLSGGTWAFSGWLLVANNMFTLCMALVFVGAVIGACLGSSKKAGKLLMIIPLIAGFAFSIWSWLYYLHSVTSSIAGGYGVQFGFIISPFTKIGVLAILLALFLFVLKNKTTWVFGKQNSLENQVELSQK